MDQNYLPFFGQISAPFIVYMVKISTPLIRYNNVVYVKYSFLFRKGKSMRTSDEGMIISNYFTLTEFFLKLGQ